MSTPPSSPERILVWLLILILVIVLVGLLLNLLDIHT